MSDDTLDIDRLAAELFRLHRAGDGAAHDKLLDSLTQEQRQAVGEKVLDIGDKMRRLEEALERDDQTALAVLAEVAKDIVRFAGVQPKPKH